MGLLRCLDKVLGHLGRITGYFTVVLRIQASTVGAPMTRPRLYIVMIRRDVLMQGTDARITQIAQQALDLMKRGPDVDFGDLLMERKIAKRKIVDAVCTCEKCKGTQASKLPPLHQMPLDDGCRWRKEHWAYMRERGLDPIKISNASKAINCRSLREKHLVATIVSEGIKIKTGNGKKKKAAVRVINKSQSIRRCNRRHDLLPCLTPKGDYWLPELGRSMTGKELLLAMGFDIGSLDVGVLSEAEQKRIAGNAMQAHSIGAALVVLFGILDRPKFTKVLKDLDGKA